MSLEIIRRIRGNVHGTIDVSRLEDVVIDHPIVQRLRRIKQLAFLHYVFPGASHSRFEHSLGVMQMAGVAWDKLRVNQRRLAESLARYPDFAARERQTTCEYGLLAPTFKILDNVFGSDYNLQLLRLAGLMHDLGHPPFSHSGERLMPSWRQVRAGNGAAPRYLRDYLDQSIDELAARGLDPDKVPVRHEVFSLLLTDKVLNDVYQQNPTLDLQVDPRDVLAVLAPKVKPDPTSPVLLYGIHGLLNELISGELDIDRMDYLLRDSRECGVVYGIFDAGRIIDSLSVYFDPKDQGLHTAITLSGLAAFEDYLRARHSMYLQLYFHKTSVGAEAMMQHLAKKINNWRFPVDPQAYAELDEYNIGFVLKGAAEKQLAPVEAAAFNHLLDDLLLRRRIWKRVFEVSGHEQNDEWQQSMSTAEKVLTESGLPFEQVSTANSLTRFLPRDHKGADRNKLRLIRKDAGQLPRVVPIEDYMSVLNDNVRVTISRLYAGGCPNQQAKQGVTHVKEEILARLRH